MTYQIAHASGPRNWHDADLRLSPPRPQPVRVSVTPEPASGTTSRLFDRRLPAPGSVITRQYKGQLLQVLVCANGFEFEGEVFESLSAVAKRITGNHWNGFQFFRLTDSRRS